MARKINYTADWMMGLSWCLATGTDSIIPYFYAIYFGILLVRNPHLVITSSSPQSQILTSSTKSSPHLEPGAPCVA